MGVVVLVTTLGVSQSIAAREPELPRELVDTTLPSPTGRVTTVAAGGDFQAALDAAEPGDTITLEAGASFVGPFVLPAKPGSDWIIVRTSAPDSGLPRPGHRATPSDAGLMPKLVAPDGLPALRAAPGAHHFRFIGVEFTPAPGAFSFNLIELGTAARTENELPHHLVFDRCYIHGDPARGSQRGIALNARSAAVIDSYLSDFKDTRVDTQAIAVWNGPGPFKIVNNYLEAAGENLLLGGADPWIRDLVPSDIEIRHNYFSKPRQWRIEDPGYAGTPWAVKNLLELKNARRVLITGNVLEHNWVHAQNGFAILFTVRNQDGAAPWSVVEDVTFTYNILRHSASGFNVLSMDGNFLSEQARRILIRDNLLLDISGARWGASGDGRLFQLLGPHGLSGAADVTIAHNTGFQDGPLLVADGAPSPGFVYRDNIIPEGLGVVGSDAAPGLGALRMYFPDAVYEGNVQAGGNSPIYPPGNFFPAELSDIGFVNLEGGDFRLAADSPYLVAPADGRSPGADVEAVLRATAGVEAGINNEPPDCSRAQASPAVLWPPNHRLVLVRIVGVTDPNTDLLTIKVTNVTQNEPVNARGDGNTSPDALIQDDGVLLRAERAGQGTGRVYSVSFMAADEFGAACEGTVTVEVPHSQRRR